ncbi:MAG: glutamine-synthetase adenylyltransferase, partial [Thalassovita sp.]|nr:glutamine-synthetase adenylyltransferase [Thalassovita sp.]
DLDVIVIYDPDGAEASDGPKPLMSSQYYAKLTKALVTALSAPMAEGRLYEIDMRLRPSGTQGPVAVSLTSFRDYQQNEAWTWEHLALTRARAVAGAPDVAGDVEAVRREVLTSRREGAKVIADVADMRAKIAAAKSPAGPWEAKIGPGRLQDIELLAQASALIFGSCAQSVPEALDEAVRGGWLDEGERQALIASYQLCWKLQMVSKLLTDKPLDPDAIGQGGCAMLLRETGAADIGGLLADLAAKTQAAGEVIDAALARDVAGPR